MSYSAYTTVKWFVLFVCLLAAALAMTCGQKSVDPQGGTPPLPVTATFEVSDTSGAPPLTVQFSDLSDGNPDFWFWRFGDGQTSLQQNPSHQFTAEGRYDVSLVVARGEVRDSVVRVGLILVDDSISVAAPDAQFTGTPLIGPAPLSVQFTNQSTGTISSVEWNFGDGISSTDDSPSHLYMTPGIYSVRLIVTGPGGVDTLVRNNFVTVTIPKPTALFTANPTSGQPPLAVSFDNQSSGSISEFKWYFGDGDSASVRNPSHSYNAAGLYTVTLIAIGPGGADTLTISNYIAVSDGRPIAAFTALPTLGIAPLTVQFTNNSAGAITSYSWDFGDNASSTQASPAHQYAAAGSYTVRLIVTGPGGADTTSRANYITVQSAPPVADFSASPTSGLVPLDVSFTNLSTGDITGYLWSFGDGQTSTDTHPVHRFTTGGVYSVRLITTGPGGIDTLTRTNLITTTWPRPTAAFTANPTTGVIPYQVAFTNSSTGQITSYAWDFGDGGTSTAQAPSHQYTVAGTYSVRLIVTGPGGVDTLQRVNYIEARWPRPTAGFTGVPTQGTVPFDVNFTNSSSGQITTFAWDFGDGGTSALASPSHRYTVFGTYSVRLIVTGPGGVDTLLRTNYITANAVVPTAAFTAAPTRGNIPLIVNFTDQSTGIITSWNWRFGTTITSNVRNPIITFSTAGVYDVRLIVTGPGGVDTLIQPAYIIALPPVPVADFSGNPTSGDAPLTVTFTNLSQGIVDSYEWDFGDGQSSTTPSPNHEYVTPGIYDVRLIVRGPGGADTLTRVSYITARTPRPIAAFDGTPTSGIAPLTVQFTDNSFGEIDLYRWSFGDGVTSTLQNPSHEYNVPGRYDVRLIVFGPGGEDTLVMPEYIEALTPPPSAAFEGVPTTGVAPLNVQFNDLSSGAIDSYLWEFGDGQTSTAQNPQHLYSTPGRYTVRLTVSGPGGSNGAQRTNYIDVLIPPPSVGFSGNPTSGIAPLAVTFTNLTTGQVDSYLWAFGDGQTSTAANPLHQYATPGTYSVRLTATGPGGSDGLLRSDYITVQFPPPTADFSGNPTSGIAPLTVTFANLTSGQVDSYLWDFGDGQTSSAANPSHQYATPGTYSVRLTATGPGGTDDILRSDYITVQFPPPVADFSADPVTGVDPLEVTFTDLSTGQIDTYSWDFGDGNLSAEQSPLHTYADPGTYTVTLTVTGSGGQDTRVRQDLITVENSGPFANFDASPTTGVAPLDVQFNNLSTGIILTSFWDFGDGQTSLLPSPSHQYQSAGTYSVTLVVVGALRIDTLRRVDYIVVNEPPPVAAFTANETSGLAPFDVQFSNLSTGAIDSFAWDFGDGNTSTEKEPLHQYQTAGIYSVQLIVSGPGGADTLLMVDYITVLSIDGGARPTPKTLDRTAPSIENSALRKP